MRYDQKACPLSGKRIENTARGGRRKYSCPNCGSTINNLLVDLAVGGVSPSVSAAALNQCGKAGRERLAAAAARLTLDNCFRDITH